MSQENIEFGSFPNDPNADAVRAAFQKAQNNFTQLFEATIASAGVATLTAGSGIRVSQPVGNVLITANIPSVTIQTGNSLLVGVSTATTNSATITSGTSPFVITLANTITTGNIVATGNLVGILSANSNSQPNIKTVGTLTSLSSSGNITAPYFKGNIVATTIQGTFVSPGSNSQVLFNANGTVAASANFTFTGTALSVLGNIISSNATLGNAAVANYFVGNIVGSVVNGSSNIQIPTTHGNINFSIGGNANVVVITDSGVDLTGTLNVSGDTVLSNVQVTGLLVGLGNVSGSNISTAGVVSAVGNVIGGNLTTASDVSAGGNIIGANVTSAGTVAASIVRASSTISAIGNVIGGNVTTVGRVSATGNIQGGNITTIGNVSATGNLIGNSLILTGVISAVGNVKAGNLSVVGNIIAGNIAGENLAVNGTISTLGNIISGNADLGNAATASYFIGSGANLFNINGANIIGPAGSANVSNRVNITLATAGVYYPSLVNATSGNLQEQANTNLSFDVTTRVLNTVGLSASGNIIGANLYTIGTVSTTGNVKASNIIATGSITASGDFSSANILANGAISANGNIVGTNANLGNTVSANYFVGSGSLLTDIQASSLVGAVAITQYALTADYANAVDGANVQGTVSIASFATTAQTANLAGTVTTNTQSNITSVGTLTSLGISGNLTAGNANLGNAVRANFFIGSGNNLSNIQAANVIGTVSSANVSARSTVTQATTGVYYPTFVTPTSGNLQLFANSGFSFDSTNGTVNTTTVNATGNITAANISLGSTGQIQCGIITSGANTNAGNITGNWTLTTGSRLQATYADLAEYYAADSDILSGTVVEFGGEYEIRICDTVMSNKIAGVVTTEPAYVMNTNIDCKFPIAIALQGRVPVKVTGSIRKGDMMISAGNGMATAFTSPMVGTIIGKSLEDFDGDAGIIEVAIGRV